MSRGACELLTRTSPSVRCVPNVTFGCTENGASLWVNGGCSGVFRCGSQELSCGGLSSKRQNCWCGKAFPQCVARAEACNARTPNATSLANTAHGTFCMALEPASESSSDFVSNMIGANGFWETSSAHQLSLLAPHLAPKTLPARGILLDIGANVGFYVLLAPLCPARLDCLCHRGARAKRHRSAHASAPT